MAAMRARNMLCILILCLSAFSEALAHDINSRTIDVSSSFPPSNAGCTVMISVIGKGFSDKFEDYCSDESAQAISREEYFIFGNPEKRKLCLYTDDWNTMVVINGNKCTKKIYKTINGISTSTPESVSAEICQSIKSFMADKLKRAQKPTMARSPSRGRPGPPDLSPSSTRSNYPPYAGTQPSPDKSLSPSQSYKEQPNARPTGPMPRSDSGMSQPSGRPWGQKPTSGSDKSFTSPPSNKAKPSEPQTGSTVLKAQIPAAAYGDFFHSSVQTHSSYGGTNIKITVAGRGIYDIIEHQTSVKPSLKVRRSDSTLIIQDPNNEEIAVYSNEPSALVIVKKGQCTKRRYTLLDEMSTKITFHDVGGGECAAIMQEMEDLPNSNDSMDHIWNHFDREVEDYQRQMSARHQMFFQGSKPAW